jgi:hypothetical protein
MRYHEAANGGSGFLTEQDAQGRVPDLLSVVEAARHTADADARDTARRLAPKVQVRGRAAPSRARAWPRADTRAATAPMPPRA